MYVLVGFACLAVGAGTTTLLFRRELCRMARFLRGRDVRIGADCEIDRVEYSGTCEIADAAVVRESARVGA